MKQQNKEYLRPKEAIKLHNELGYGYISYDTILKWFKKYKFGKKIGGKIFISKDKFIKILNGE